MPGPPVQHDKDDDQSTTALFQLVYGELRELARAKLANEKAGHTLQTTALVHEAYLRIASESNQRWKSRAQFFAAAAESMRRILIDHARGKLRKKRGGNFVRVDLAADALANQQDDEQLLALDEALTRFEAIEPLKAAVVKLRYFAGCRNTEVAELLEISPTTAKRYWSYARAWLIAEIDGPQHVVE